MKRQINPSGTPSKVRIFLKRHGSARATRRYVLIAPPFPDQWDRVTIGDEDWIVSKVEDASDAIEVEFPAQAKKVFP